jgi:LPS-assembly protein
MKKGVGLLLTSLAVFLICGLNPHCVFASGNEEKAILESDDDTPWEITAESFGYTEEEGVFKAQGDVFLTNGYLLLWAQEALYNTDSGNVEVSGNIRFEAGADTLTGEKGFFNLNDRTGKIIEGSLFLKENHYYISADVLEKTGEETYRATDFRLTTCDGPAPAWSITGSEATVTIEGYGRIRNAAFRVGEIPFFYLPYMIFPAKTKRQTGLLPPALSYSDRNGMEMEIPFFWAISEHTDATFYERFMSRRGLMQGIEFRYLYGDNSRGTYLLDFLRDRIQEKDLNNPEHTELGPFERTNKTRYWLRSRTEQQLPGGNIMVRLDTDVVSDQDYLKEFREGLSGFETRPDLEEDFRRPVEEINSPARRSALRLSRDEDNYSVQVLSSYYQRPEGFTDDETPQPLAGIDFVFLPRSLFELPLTFSMESDYDYIWRESGVKGHSISISPFLTFPSRLGTYLEFEPSIGITRNMQWYSSNTCDIHSRSRNVYHLQARLSSVLERIFDLDGKQAKRLRHKIEPSFLYEYRIYEGEDGFMPWFDPIDKVGETNRIIFSLDNFVDVKKQDSKGNITYARWVAFSLAQGYDNDESAFEPLAGLLTLMPLPGLDLDTEFRWDHDKDKISFADFSFDFVMERSGGRQDTFEIDYVYLDEGNKGLSYYLNVHLPHGLSAGSSLQRDIDLGHDIEKSCWIEYLAQCWGVRLTLERFDEESSINLTFRLLGLGD